MKVLVTGGAGYIGSHAVRGLVRAGHEVVVLDDLSHGHHEAVDAKARLVVGDVGDEALVRRTVRENGIESAMHFAAFIEVGESMANPFQYYRNNVTHALLFFHALRECGVKHVVFSSTAAVYGNPLATPIEENHPCQPINPYGRSKMMTEMILEDFRVAYGIGYAILRYFNVAGASPDSAIGEKHEPESHLIPRILMTALEGSANVTIYGTDYPTPDGTCIRDYLHVEDLVAAHLLALERLKPGVGRIYNLGSESGFSVREVIEACRRVTGCRLPTQELPRRPGDPAVLVASSAKIRDELGWTRQYPDLETIVMHAWNWHQRQHAEVAHGKTDSDQTRRKDADPLQPQADR